MPEEAFQTTVAVSLERLSGSVQRIEDKLDSLDQKFTDKTLTLAKDVEILEAEVARLKAGHARMVGVAIGASAVVSTAITAIVQVV